MENLNIFEFSVIMEGKQTVPLLKLLINVEFNIKLIFWTSLRIQTLILTI